MHNFDKSRRLLTKAEFDAVFKLAKKKVIPGFVVLYRPNQLTHARLGCVLSKRMLAKAHQRNRIKRVLRESFRQQILPGFDVIFLARHGLAKNKNADITTRLSDVWNELCGK
jgi:ribonuclease P protein component